MRRPLPCLLVLAALLAGCSGGGGGTAAPQPTASPAPVEPFEALAPPTSPGVGSFEAFSANRAYKATQSLLALQLLEKPTLAGGNRTQLAAALQGAFGPGPATAAVGGAPTRGALDYRPLFPPGTTFSEPVATVTSSIYNGEEVQAPSGDKAMRVTWTGTLTYAVTVKGATGTVTYNGDIAYLFAPIAAEPGGMALQAVAARPSSAQGVITACLAKGVLYPGAASARCPL